MTDETLVFAFFMLSCAVIGLDKALAKLGAPAISRSVRN